MVRKKKRTSAQIAATKKMLAGLKKYRKKNPAKKKVAKKKVVKKKSVTRRSQTKPNKKPGARLIARRKKNTKKGYFPNPIRYALKSGKKYYDGSWWSTAINKAVLFQTKKHAIYIAQKLANIVKKPIGVTEIKK